MEKYSFFNSVNNDRVYNASDFANYFSTLVGTGVFPIPDDGLQVTSNNNMTVNLKAGKAWINGYMYQNTDNLTLNISTADSLLNRIDRVVIRYSTIDRNITATIKTGTVASNPVAPTLQRDSDIYELGLADIYISAGATTIITSNITDLRMNNDLCGWVNSLVEKNLTEIFNKYMAQIGILSQLRTRETSSLVEAINDNYTNIQMTKYLMDELKSNIQNTDYNIYQLYLQNYYDSRLPYYKGMFFDGFANSNVIDAGSSTATLDTAAKRITYERTISNGGGSYVLVNNPNSQTTTISQSFSLQKTTKIKNIRIPIYRYYNNTLYSYPVSIPGDGSSNININISIYNAVDNLPSGNAIVSSDQHSIIYNTPLGDTYFTFSGVSLPAGNYCFVVTGTYTWNGNDRIAIGYSGAYSDGACYLNNSLQTADLNFAILYENNDDVIYQSQEQTFDQLMDNSTLYVKYKTATGSSVSAQIAIYNTGGTITYNNMTLESVRDIGSGYSEGKYTILGLPAGNKAKIKLTMSRTDILQDLYISSYGCILGVA